MRRALSILTLVVAVLCLAGVAWWAQRTKEASPSPTRTKVAAVPQPRPPVKLPPPQLEPPTPAPASQTPGKTPARLVFGSGWDHDPDAAQAAFTAWASQYTQADAATRAQAVAEGVKLAQERRAVVKDWIRHDPERALAAAVPIKVREQLPAEVTTWLEQRVSGQGELTLLGATPAPGGTVPEPIFRRAYVGGQEFFAYTYGRRATLPTLDSVSLHGVAIDDVIAVSDSPVRELEPGETANGRPVEEQCPVSGITTPLAASETPAFNGDVKGPKAIEYSGKIVVTCQPGHARKIETTLMAQETGTREINLGNNLPGTSGVSGRPAKAWTHGTKKLLIIRVDFSDLAGVPVNPSDSNAPIYEDYVVNRINGANGVRDFYEQASFGKTSISMGAATDTGAASDSPDVTAVLRMPKTASYYATGYKVDELHSAARTAAATAGFNMNDYDRIGVVFKDMSSIPSSQISFGGLGGIESKNFWINGYFTFSIVAHEIGHNYGLQHSSLWKVTDNNPVSASGTSVEYGDKFDVMGNGSSIDHHFSPWNKSILQWIPDSAVNGISSSGTYRVYRFDHKDANLANSMALKIVRSREEDYWIGYRRATTNASLDGGAYVAWGYNDNRRGNLLDLTAPYGGSNDVDNAALAVGATFNDSAAGITLHPVAQGGSGADEYLDVEVTLQTRISWDKAEFVVDEQVGSAVLTLNRSYGSSGAVSVSYATSPGTATTADYTTSSGTVNWADGDMAPKTINIPIVADAIVEGAHSFTVTLSNPTGGAIIADGATTTVTIADPGAKDPTFAPGFASSSINKILVLPNGSLILGGWFDSWYDVNATQYARSGIAMAKPDGSFDPDFAVEGGAGGGGNTRVEDIARQPDGKLVVVGDFTTFHGQTRNGIVRLEADGTMDSSFDVGTGAKIGANAAPVNAVLVQPDGKIIIGGDFTSYNGTTREYLARLNADGSLDTSFVGPDFGQASGWSVESLALQPDGKLLVGGVFFFSGGSFKAGLCRVTSTGSLDSSFNGVVEGAHATSTSDLRTVRAIQVLQDGKILIAGGFTKFNNTTRGGLARLTSTGALDGAFAPTSNGSCDSILVQPDGRIIVGGDFTTFNSVSANRLVRLSSVGVLETSFSAAGGATPSGSFLPSIATLALQPDGKVIMGGDFMYFQNSSPTDHTFWRFFGGFPGLPGTVEMAQETLIGSEGTDVPVTVNRTGGSNGTISVGYSTAVGTAGMADFIETSGVLTWSDGDSAPKTITVHISTDALADNGETFKLNIGEPQMNSAILGASQSTVITISGSIIDSWRQTYFTQSELDNPSISGLTVDFDQDGLSNLMEFAFNSSPKTASDFTRPVAGKITIDNLDYATLTFRRRSGTSSGLTYTPLTNGSLPGTWVNDAEQVGGAVNNGDGTETVTYRDVTPLSPGGQRFMELQVTYTE